MLPPTNWLASVQVVPPFVVLRIPNMPPAYTVVGVTGSIAKVAALESGVLNANEAPLFELLKIPSSVAAKTFVEFKGSMTTDVTPDAVSGETGKERGLQLFPPFVLLKSPVLQAA